jgi:NAD(P)-dependent dehydrogenase (short-subunit alcohol dehydrogenase family)
MLTSLFCDSGTIATPLVTKARETHGEIYHSAVFSRRGQPEEVAALIAYFLGDESRFTTGAAYSIDGGWNC